MSAKGKPPHRSVKEAAIEEERARQNLRELARVKRDTRADVDRVRDAQAALDDARRRS